MRWIIDSRATARMTRDLRFFISYDSFPSNQKVTTACCDILTVAGVGCVYIPYVVTLILFLYVPQPKLNLFPVSALQKTWVTVLFSLLTLVFIMIMLLDG